MSKHVEYDHSKYLLWIVKDWETFKQFLEAESTVKILKCFANWCGYCHKFQPVYQACAPPANAVTSNNSSHWPLFAAFDSDKCSSLINSVWFPNAIQMGLCPPGSKYIEGGKPNFMIFSGTEHSFARKNQILGSYVSYCEQARFLALLEYYVGGLLQQTDTFSYLSPEAINEAMQELPKVKAIKAAEAIRAKIGGAGDTKNDNVPAGGADEKKRDVPCNNPDCPKHGKNKQAGTASQPGHGDGKTDCKNPNCPVHGKSGGGGAPIANTSATQQWNRKLLFQQKKTNRPIVFQEPSLIPAVHSSRSAGKTYFSTFHEDTGMQTFWEVRYPPATTGPNLKNVNQSVVDLAMDMTSRHQIPWKIVPDQSVDTVTLKLQTKQLGVQSKTGGDGKQWTEYQPQVFEGVQAYNWISNYGKSLDALSKQSPSVAKKSTKDSKDSSKNNASVTAKKTKINLWE